MSRRGKYTAEVSIGYNQKETIDFEVDEDDDVDAMTENEFQQFMDDRAWEAVNSGGLISVNWSKK